MRLFAGVAAVVLALAATATAAAADHNQCRPYDTSGWPAPGMMRLTTNPGVQYPPCRPPEGGFGPPPFGPRGKDCGPEMVPVYQHPGFMWHKKNRSPRDFFMYQ